MGADRKRKIRNTSYTLVFNTGPGYPSTAEAYAAYSTQFALLEARRIGRQDEIEASESAEDDKALGVSSEKLNINGKKTSVKESVGEQNKLSIVTKDSSIIYFGRYEAYQKSMRFLIWSKALD